MCSFAHLDCYVSFAERSHNAATGSGQFRVRDWLAVHNLEKERVRCDVARWRSDVTFAPNDNDDPTLDAGRCGLSLNEAWAMAAAAMFAWRPDQSHLIDTTLRDTVLQASKDGRSFTAPVDADLTVVSVAYHNDADSLLVVAHEFGHAVHAASLRGAFAPPAVREACAFVAETMLLKWLIGIRSDLVAPTLKAARMAEDRCRRLDCDPLLQALDDPEALYTYRWNYPIARAALREGFDRDPWLLFLPGARLI